MTEVNLTFLGISATAATSGPGTTVQQNPNLAAVIQNSGTPTASGKSTPTSLTGQSK